MLDSIRTSNVDFTTTVLNDTESVETEVAIPIFISRILKPELPPFSNSVSCQLTHAARALPSIIRILLEQLRSSNLALSPFNAQYSIMNFAPRTPPSRINGNLNTLKEKDSVAPGSHSLCEQSRDESLLPNTVGRANRTEAPTIQDGFVSTRKPALRRGSSSSLHFSRKNRMPVCNRGSERTKASQPIVKECVRKQNSDKFDASNTSATLWKSEDSSLKWSRDSDGGPMLPEDFNFSENVFTGHPDKNPAIRNLPRTIDTRFLLGDRLADGFYFVVHEAVDAETGDKVVLKLEDGNVKYGSIQNELSVYSILLAHPKARQHVPKIISAGSSDGLNYVAMERLGPSLGSIAQKFEKLSQKTIAAISTKVFTIIRDIHDAGILHLHICPEDLLTGTEGNDSKIYLVNFGLAKTFLKDAYTHVEDREHVEWEHDSLVTGPCRVASRYKYEGKTLSRRDELFSFGSLLHLFAFMDSCCLRKDWEEKTYEQNCMDAQSITPVIHGAWYDFLDNEFKTFMQYVECLKFHDAPNYDFLEYLLRAGARKFGVVGDELVWEERSA